MKVKLYVCLGGKGQDSFAERLQKKLPGSIVEAPDVLLSWDYTFEINRQNGSEFVTLKPVTFFGPGRWVTFPKDPVK